MTTVYAEFKNGDRKNFYGRDETEAICAAVDYAEEHDTAITYYTEILK